MVLLFGLSYFTSTIGALGVGFIIGEYETRNEKWFENGFIYKEITLGNALADYRGKRIEITRTVNWFPIIEWHIMTKDYFNVIVYGEPLNVDYNPVNEEFYLDVEKKWGDSIHYWTDTIRLKK